MLVEGLRKAERNMQNYSSMKLEFLAPKWAVNDKFRDYLLGNKCLVFTDNNSLSYYQSAKLGAVEQRWASQLAAFDLEIRYKPGKANGNADALSHQYVDATVEVIAPLTLFPVLLKQAIQEVSCPDMQATQEAVITLPA